MNQLILTYLSPCADADVALQSKGRAERLREVAGWLRDKLGGPSVLVLGSIVDSRPQLLTMVSPSLTPHGLHAGKLLNQAAQAMQVSRSAANVAAG